MKMPFSHEQFFSAFENYNESVFPAQIILLLLGTAALYLAIKPVKANSKIIGGSVGLSWIWAGSVYHISFFSEINPVAVAFGILFVLQGILVLMETFIRKKPEFSNIEGFRGILAISLIVLGLYIYPAVSYLLEGSLSKVISFGLPCPTTLATFGFILLADNTISKYLLIIPSLWAVMVIPVALNFGIYQDFMLVISAVIAGIYLFRNQKKIVSVPG